MSHNVTSACIFAVSSHLDSCRDVRSNHLSIHLAKLRGPLTDRPGNHIATSFHPSYTEVYRVEWLCSGSCGGREGGEPSARRGMCAARYCRPLTVGCSGGICRLALQRALLPLFGGYVASQTRRSPLFGVPAAPVLVVTCWASCHGSSDSFPVHVSGCLWTIMDKGHPGWKFRHGEVNGSTKGWKVMIRLVAARAARVPAQGHVPASPGRGPRGRFRGGRLRSRKRHAPDFRIIEAAMEEEAA